MASVIAVAGTCLEDDTTTTSSSTTATLTQTTSSPPLAKYCTDESPPTWSTYPSTFSGAATTPMFTTIELQFNFNSAKDDRNLTTLLIDISEILVTPDNADTVSENLHDALQFYATTMTEYDVYLSAFILFNISLVYPLSYKAFNISVQTVNIILNQDQRTIRRSNYLYNTTEYIQKFFFQSTAHTTTDFLVQDTEHVFASVQHLECKTTEKEATVKLVQYKSGTVCIYNQSIDQTSSSKIDTFIELPVEGLCQETVKQSNNVKRKRSSDDQEYRIGLVLYKNQKLFGKENPVNSTSGEDTPCIKQKWPQCRYVTTMDVVSSKNIASGEVPKEKFNLTQPVLFGSNINNESKELLHARDACSHWNAEHGWISSGCLLVESIDGIKRCQCDHLTDFTLVVDVSIADPSLCDQSLSNFSLALMILSMIAIFVALALYLFRRYYHRCVPKSRQKSLFFRSLRAASSFDAKARKDAVAEWLMGSVFVFLFFFCLLSDSRILNLSRTGCNTAAAVLYCFLLCTICWTAAAAFHIFKNTYLVFYKKWLDLITKQFVTLAFCCVVPIFFTLTVALADKEFFARDDLFCWIRPEYDYIFFGVVLPITAFIVVDLVLTGFLIKALFFHNVTYMQSAAGRKRALIQKCVKIVSLQVLMGLPWVLQYFTLGSPNSEPIHYFFVFFNATQGLWIALFYIFGWVTTIRAAADSLKTKRTVPQSQRLPLVRGATLASSTQSNGTEKTNVTNHSVSS